MIGSRSELRDEHLLELDALDVVPRVHLDPRDLGGTGRLAHDRDDPRGAAEVDDALALDVLGLDDLELVVGIARAAGADRSEGEALVPLVAREDRVGDRANLVEVGRRACRRCRPPGQARASRARNAPRWPPCSCGADPALAPRAIAVPLLQRRRKRHADHGRVLAADLRGKAPNDLGLVREAQGVALENGADAQITGRLEVLADELRVDLEEPLDLLRRIAAVPELHGLLGDAVHPALLGRRQVRPPERLRVEPVDLRRRHGIVDGQHALGDERLPRRRGAGDQDGGEGCCGHAAIECSPVSNLAPGLLACADPRT